MLPRICRSISLAVMKSMMNESPSPVSRLYVKSDNAAPSPVKKAGRRPLFRVLWMTSIPIGPIGADTNTPMRSPLVNMWNRMSIRIAKLTKLTQASKKILIFQIPFTACPGLLAARRGYCLSKKRRGPVGLWRWVRAVACQDDKFDSVVPRIMASVFFV